MSSKVDANVGYGVSSFRYESGENEETCVWNYDLRSEISKLGSFVNSECIFLFVLQRQYTATHEFGRYYGSDRKVLHILVAVLLNAEQNTDLDSN